MISRYASNSLPHQAKMAVRGFILDLPGRCATLSDIRSTATSPAASPLLTPTSEGLPQEQTAIRLLSFGQESVDMLQSVSVVFSDTVDRAELWLDKLRTYAGQIILKHVTTLKTTREKTCWLLFIIIIFAIPFHFIDTFLSLKKKLQL